jgi:hypothetical protein
MDTDQLTEMAYRCLRLANDATDCLKAELGAACSRFRDEDEYLKGVLKYVTEIEARPVSYLESWNLLQQTNPKVFKHNVQILRKHIEKTIRTTRELRGPSEW